NSTSVTEQVKYIQNRPNLLLWYTGDEPDGTSDPLNATTIAYDLIYSLDGYHPVSLVLNCQDYEWSAYTAGTDIVMQDAYMVSNNVTWSNEWHTVCTPDFGDCGCDNCLSIPAGSTSSVPPNSTGVGSYFDISSRVSSFKSRLEVMGWERTKAVWTVPQAFGGEEYWLRAPTGEEWVVQSIMGINQGALGVVPWVDPSPVDIKEAASAFAYALPRITHFLFDPTAIRSNFIVGGVDIATWKTGEYTLVLAANTYYTTANVAWSDLGLKPTGASSLYESGIVKTTVDGFSLGSVGSGAFV
ncbi:hypothetical protein BJ138DRAFT_964745, partial [Hygrophoropsis aurantiaca]